MTSSHSAGSISRNGPTSVRPALFDEAVHAPEPLDDRRDEPLGLAAVRDVGGEGRAVGAGVADARERLLGRRRRTAW